MKQSIYTSLFRRSFGLLALFILFSFSSCGGDGGEDDSVNAAIAIEDQDILVGESVLFKNNTIATDETVVWDFGDGTILSKSNPSHSYSTLGSYVITLKVVNKSNNTEKSRATKIVTVSLSDDISGRITLKEKLSTLNGKIVVCAHRATEVGFPENSLLAIQNAIDLGIEMVEIDIRETKDGELVLMHDASITRTTSGTGNVSSYTLQEIKQFNLKQDNGSLTTQKIPTLKEVFDLARGKIYINLDLDSKAPFTKVYPLAKQYGMLKQVMFYNKDNTAIRSMLTTNANLLVLPYIDDETEFNSFSNVTLGIVHYSDTSFNPTLVKKASDKSISVYANVYVNTNTTPQSDGNFQMDKFITLKGNVIQTDHPEYIKTYLKDKNLN
jgi:glycerophosphoryl diester phosphodiesterase